MRPAGSSTEKLGQYALELVVANMAILLFVFGPLIVFLPTLVAAKRAGLKTYGLLAERYVRAFDRKWVSGDARPSEPLLGSPTFARSRI